MEEDNFLLKKKNDPSRATIFVTWTNNRARGNVTSKRPWTECGIELRVGADCEQGAFGNADEAWLRETLHNRRYASPPLTLPLACCPPGWMCVGGRTERPGESGFPAVASEWYRVVAYKLVRRLPLRPCHVPGPFFVSLLVYWTQALAALVRSVGVQFGHSSTTNLAYLVPALALVGFRAVPSPFPPAFAFLSLEAAASLAYHASGCTDVALATLDHFAYLVLFTHLAVQAAVKAASRFLCPCGLALYYLEAGLNICALCATATFYVFLQENRVAYLLAIGLPSLVLLFVDAWWVRGLGATATAVGIVLTLAMLGVAQLYSEEHEEEYELFPDGAYDVSHGVWHLLTAQMQGVLLYLLLTDFVLPSERRWMAATAFFLGLEGLFLLLDMHALWVRYLMSALATGLTAYALLKRAY